VRCTCLLASAAVVAVVAAAMAVAGAGAGCSSAQTVDTDARRVDAAHGDGPLADAATDAATDAASDAAADADSDAAGCGISTGDTVALDGNGDLAAYPASQVLTPGVPLAAGDRIAITWDPTYLYVTAVSASFAGELKPLHVYLETRALAAAVPATGKEYGGDTPFVPFSPDHLIALRRTDDAGGGTGAYDGVYTPAAAWTTKAFALVPGTHVFASADGGTLSVRTPWTALGGCPAAMRLAAHVVHGDVANDWKDTVPATHTPWVAPGGGYHEIDLTADPAIAGWAVH
jgi:hypothetical protein